MRKLFLILLVSLCLPAVDLEAAPARGLRAKLARVLRKSEPSRTPRAWNSKSRAALRPAFHMVTKPTYARLHPETQRNIDATGRYQGRGATGTMFLVSPIQRDGSALVLTNAHVVAGSVGGHVTFHSGDNRDWSSAEVIESVVVSKADDAALVWVRFPKPGWFSKRIQPAQIASQALESGKKIYSTGYPGLKYDLANENRQMIRGRFGKKKDYAERHDGVSFQTVRLEEAVRANLPTIAVGYENGRQEQALAAPSHTYFGGLPREAYKLFLPATGGASGSAVFSAETHKVVALVAAANTTLSARTTYAIPIQQVLSGLSKRMAEGHFTPPPKQLRSHLQNLLKR